MSSAGLRGRHPGTPAPTAGAIIGRAGAGETRPGLSVGSSWRPPNPHRTAEAR
jgi:hypothetical protein